MQALLILVLVSMSVFSSASPYLRLIDVRHPKPVIGAMLAPEKLKSSEAASLLPLLTHSPRDGCLFPSIICEDWSPIAVGGSMSSGRLSFEAGPLFNVLPWMQTAASAATPQSWTAVRSILASNPDSSVSFSAGPLWAYKSETNKGYFRIFTGLALHF